MGRDKGQMSQSIEEFSTKILKSSMHEGKSKDYDWEKLFLSSQEDEGYELKIMQ